MREPKNNCRNCRNCIHSWTVGEASKLIAYRCDNTKSRRYRMFLEAYSTCKEWAPVLLEAAE